MGLFGTSCFWCSELLSSHSLCVVGLCGHLVVQLHSSPFVRLPVSEIRDAPGVRLAGAHEQTNTLCVLTRNSAVRNGRQGLDVGLPSGLACCFLDEPLSGCSVVWCSSCPTFPEPRLTLTLAGRNGSQGPHCLPLWVVFCVRFQKLFLRTNDSTHKDSCSQSVVDCQKPSVPPSVLLPCCRVSPTRRYMKPCPSHQASVMFPSRDHSCPVVCFGRPVVSSSGFVVASWSDREHRSAVDTGAPRASHLTCRTCRNRAH